MSEKLDTLITLTKQRAAEGGGRMWEKALESLTGADPEQGREALAIFKDLTANNRRKLFLFDSRKAPPGAKREEVEKYIAEFTDAAATIREEFHLEDEDRGVWLDLGIE